MSLLGLIGDRYNVGGVIDDHGVVNVVIDDVVRRGCDVLGRPNPDGDR